MKNTSRSPLEEIQRDLLAGDVPLTRTLQKVVLLGGSINSTELRAWAKRELDGYPSMDTLPPYRKVLAQIYLDAINGNYFAKGQSIGPDELPDVVQEHGIDNHVPLLQGIAELEEFSRREAEFVHMGLPQGDLIARMMTATMRERNPFYSVERVYYSVSTAALCGVVENVRTALADLVSELVRTMPPDRDEPTKDEADRAVHYTLTGNLAPVTLNITNSSGSGSVTTSTSAATGTGTGTSTATAASEQAKPESWWRRLRNKGVIVTLIAVLGSSAGVLNYLHWFPFS